MPRPGKNTILLKQRNLLEETLMFEAILLYLLMVQVNIYMQHFNIFSPPN